VQSIDSFISWALNEDTRKQAFSKKIAGKIGFIVANVDGFMLSNL